MTGENATLVLPETFVNLSGKAVSAFIKSPKAAKNLLVVHDDLDLPLGTVKLVFGRGSGGHKGVESIMRAVKTKDFARIRIGISGVGKKHQAKESLGRGESHQARHREVEAERGSGSEESSKESRRSRPPLRYLWN